MADDIDREAAELDGIHYDLMRHALGVRRDHKGRWSKPCRNHFVAGGASVAAWDALVAAGFATKREGRLPSEMPVYHVTDAGRDRALAGITYERRWGYGTPHGGAS